MLDASEFLSPYGIRSLSRYHRDHPYVLTVDGAEHRVDYEPAESTTGLFGGNSNWRGPDLVPGQLPADRVAAEVPPLLRRRPQGRVPDRLRPAAEPVGGGRRAVAPAHAALPARRATAAGPVYGGDRALPARSALARPGPVPRVLPRRRRRAASAPATRRAGPAWWPSSSSRAASDHARPSTWPSVAGPTPPRSGRWCTAMAEAGVRIADELARAALIGQLGTTGEINVQGEKVKKLDVWANDVVVAALDATGRTCTLVSEEMEEIRHSRERCAEAGFVVCFDPVDGSSNLDVNGIVGTIFSVLKRRGEGADHARDRRPAAGDGSGGGRVHHVRPVHPAGDDDRRRRARLHARSRARSVRPHAHQSADARPAESPTASTTATSPAGPTACDGSWSTSARSTWPAAGPIRPGTRGRWSPTCIAPCWRAASFSIPRTRRVPASRAAASCG